jgi:hypothetical protein
MISQKSVLKLLSESTPPVWNVLVFIFNIFIENIPDSLHSAVMYSY